MSTESMNILPIFYSEKHTEFYDEQQPFFRNFYNAILDHFVDDRYSDKISLSNSILCLCTALEMMRCGKGRDNVFSSLLLSLGIPEDDHELFFAMTFAVFCSLRSIPPHVEEFFRTAKCRHHLDKGLFLFNSLAPDAPYDISFIAPVPERRNPSRLLALLPKGKELAPDNSSAPLDNSLGNALPVFILNCHKKNFLPALQQLILQQVALFSHRYEWVAVFAFLLHNHLLSKKCVMADFVRLMNSWTLHEKLPFRCDQSDLSTFSILLDISPLQWKDNWLALRKQHNSNALRISKNSLDNILKHYNQLTEKYKLQ